MGAGTTTAMTHGLGSGGTWRLQRAWKRAEREPRGCRSSRVAPAASARASAAAQALARGSPTGPPHRRRRRWRARLPLGSGSAHLQCLVVPAVPPAAVQHDTRRLLHGRRRAGVEAQQQRGRVQALQLRLVRGRRLQQRLVVLRATTACQPGAASAAASRLPTNLGPHIAIKGSEGTERHACGPGVGGGVHSPQLAQQLREGEAAPPAGAPGRLLRPRLAVGGVQVEHEPAGGRASTRCQATATINGAGASTVAGPALRRQRALTDRCTRRLRASGLACC